MEKQAGDIEVRVKTRIQNAIIARFIDAHGNQKDAAATLGVSLPLLNNWLHFRAQPRRLKEPKGDKVYDDKYRYTEAFFGATLEEVFPLSKEDAVLLGLTKPRVQDIELSQAEITSSIERRYLTYEPQEDTERQIDHAVLSERLSEALDVLTERERRIVELRYGLADGTSRTHQEIGHEVHLTKERIRQLEARALHKLERHSQLRNMESSV